MVSIDPIWQSFIAAGLLREDHVLANGTLQPTGDSAEGDKANLLVEADSDSTFKILYEILSGKMLDGATTIHVQIGSSTRHSSTLTGSFMSAPHTLFSLVTPGSPASIVIRNTSKFIVPYDFSILTYEGDLHNLAHIMEVLANYHMEFAAIKDHIHLVDPASGIATRVDLAAVEHLPTALQPGSGVGVEARHVQESGRRVTSAGRKYASLSPKGTLRGSI